MILQSESRRHFFFCWVETVFRTGACDWLQSLVVGEGLVGCACYVSMKGAAGRVVLEELLARARLWDVELEV